MKEKQDLTKPKSVKLTEEQERLVTLLQKKLKRGTFTDLVRFLIEQEAERQSIK